MEEKSIQSMGGEARAKALSEEERKEIARHAAATRWSIPKAIYAGEIEIGKVIIPCAVLEDGTRLLTQEGFLIAIGRSGKPAKGRGSVVEKVAPFLALDNLKPFVDKELESSTFPIVFQPQKGRRAYGYRAELLPKVCEVYLKARDEDALLATQEKFARACDILMRGLAHIGIIALVDEATGYQEVRDRQALQKILELYISKELVKWAKRFPDDFYKEMFRLKGWDYPRVGTSKPQVVGHYTNDIVYNRISPEVLEELKKLNPPDEKGNRAHKHHQWLTPEIGHPKLRDHISGVVALMKAAETWDGFKKMIRKAYPIKKLGATIEMDFRD